MEIQRKEIYDPAFEEFVDVELPTVSIKDAARVAHEDAGGTLLERTFSGGTVMRITFLRFTAGAAQEFFMQDRNGTFDYPYLEAAGVETMLGEPMAPIHVVEGTFKIGASGSFGGSGTFASVAYEGIVRFQGTETRA